MPKKILQCKRPMRVRRVVPLKTPVGPTPSASVRFLSRDMFQRVPRFQNPQTAPVSMDVRLHGDDVDIHVYRRTSANFWLKDKIWAR